MKSVLIAQNCQAEPAGTIIDYLSERQIPYQEVHSYRREPLPDPTDYSAVICLGCPLSVTEHQKHDYLRDLYQLVSRVVRADVPYLGICFGGQLLAKVLGAKVEPNKVKEIGLYTLKLTEAGSRDPLFSLLGNSFPAVQWHGDTFAIPFGCERLVEGTDCLNQAFKQGRQVALQFHLEATEPLLQSWCEAYPKELAEVEKTIGELLMSIRTSADTLRRMNFTFLDGFFSLVKDNQPNNHIPHERVNRTR